MSDSEGGASFFNGPKCPGLTARNWWARISAPCVIAEVDERALVRYIIGKAVGTFLPSLVFGLFALKLGGWPEHLLASAVINQLSITMMKVLVYSAFVVQGLSAMTMSLRWFAPLRWLSGHIANTTFNVFCGAFGIVCGFAVFSGIEGGLLGMLEGGHFICLVLVGLAVTYFPVRIFYRKVATGFQKRPWVPVLLGAAMVVAGCWAFQDETWPELSSPPCQALTSTNSAA